jgi:hydrogenase maturation factor HypF (carbamoyltransferase family)
VSKRRTAKPKSTEDSFRMFLVPCSCGASFAVSEQYDRQGTQWSRFLVCPSCGKRHDPKNRLLQLGYHREGYWGVDDC